MTLKTKPDWAADLIELLGEQRDIYAQLQELSEKQAALVAEGDAESLLTLLAERQTLIDKLTQLNGRVEPYKQNWPTLWSQLDAQSQRRVQGLIDQVQSLLDRIVQQDERDREALSEQRERIGAQMTRTSQGSAVNKAYGAGAAEPRYTDREG